MSNQYPSKQAIGGSWSSLNPPLSPWIADVISKMGFSHMTPVQAGTIPRALKNQDCVVEAVTGSGKTLAFVVPVLERLVLNEKKFRKGEVAAMVIAPTRELASQIHDVFHHFLSSLIPPIRESSPIASSSKSPSPPPPAEFPLPCLITSGTTKPYETFLDLNSSILIGTPGRLASFLLSPRGSIVRVNDLDCLILDEADKLLSSPDHRRDVERIMSHLPKQRRTHLFSATMTDAVEEMIGLGLRNPVRIVVNLREKRKGIVGSEGAESEIKERRTPTALENTFLVCRQAEKTLQLIRLLEYESSKKEAAKFIVYFSTCAAVDYFYRILTHLPNLSSFSFHSLHGDLLPRIRESSLSGYVKHSSSHLSPSVLLCTDVASRGVDFADVDVVIQYDCPMDPKTFSHRAGRTARAGRKGKAVVLLSNGREEEYVGFLAARKIPLHRRLYLDSELLETNLPSTLDPGAPKLLAEIRQFVLTDRDLADKAAKAFVSSLRAYTKHEASFIFRLQDLDFHSMAISYGLLRLPAMPEIKEWRRKREVRADARRLKDSQMENGVLGGTEEIQAEDIAWEDANVDWDTFAYASSTREKARLEALTKKRSEPNPSEDRLNERNKRKIQKEMREAWSEQKDKKARKEERRERKDKVKQAEWERKVAEGLEDVGLVEQWKRDHRTVSNKRGLQQGDSNDEDKDPELEKEYRALQREVREEKAAKKAKKQNVQVAEGGMFDDLD